MSRHETENTKRVVIIGGGFAGLNAAKALQKHPHLSITLVDKTNHHLFQPLLYQVATAALSPGDIAMPIREIFRGQNIEVLMATVEKIDKDDHKVILDNQQVLPFDFLIIAPGARHAYFGKDAWETYAPGLKTLKDALHIRERVLASFELAERKEQPFTEDLMSFVVIGGGPTGVEMAGAIAEIAHQSLKKNFKHIDPSHTKIYLIEGGKQLLAPYPEHLAKKAQKALEKMGVTVMLNTRVTDIKEDEVFISEGKSIKAHNIIWAAGNQAAPLLQSLQVPLDKQGRVLVQNDLTIAGYPHIFVLGDASACMGKNENYLPAIAPVATQQGRYVGKSIKNVLKGKTPKPFRYWDKGMMAAIGRYDALVLSGPLQGSGFIAWILWSFVHIYFLIGFRTKFIVFFQWALYFFKGQRNIRLILKPLEFLNKK
ncbi:FAD-dependent oxidoreductase [Candidatus Berkiella aquae]|uniref:NADH:ubiquinone reductase (non-electrogenic) n=1 Tax=Candidatus Berkiella aquae TaxID=295108 RepID=A0A0Q9YW80_9GAMM|nr:NAD(P)/FAD-dependent oxidoreductase [Candidatus Berkiella aquae]MCS5711358.1 NAD(P)/FAD-dependent oxidoreductase [Candidatus Berkiella aquae]